MGNLTIDAWIMALAAVVALATASVALTLIVRLASTQPTVPLICRLTLGALPVGIGLWCVNLIGLLSAVGSPGLKAVAGLVPLPIAILGAAGALWIVADREAQLRRFLASGATIAATVCTVYAASVGELHAEIPLAVAIGHVGTVFLLSTLAYSAAICVRFMVRRERSLRGSLASIGAVLLAGAATMFVQLDAILHGTVVAPSWNEPGAGPEAPSAIIAAGALAMLAAAYVIVAYEGRLARRDRRHAREVEELRTRLQYLATHDALTALPNWTHVKEWLAQAAADTERSGRGIAVAVLDLDRFSSLNHSLGHGAGDWLLAEVARRVAAVVPPQDMFARLGSDEFVVLIDSVAARLEAECLMGRIIGALREPITVHGSQVHVYPSIGVSVWPDHGRRVDDLLVQAEVALALAKKRGGNLVQFFQRDMNDSMQERLALENDLRRAVSAGEFELWFQPELSVRSGRIVAAEALVRWRHPTRGLIDPSLFIPLAETTGLIIPLGDWVLREACRHVRAWDRLGREPIRVAVNLSAAQFRHSALVEVIQSALRAEGLAAACLEVELTESAVMINPEESVGIVKQLRRMGITVAIDDFGTGYSSLSYLRHFRIDKLKVDRSFVRDLTGSGTDKSIVRAIIELAHSMGLSVVAEGVETEEQLHAVRSLGCDMWQGFYCCEPQPAQVFANMLAAQSDTRTGLVAALTHATQRSGC